MNDAFSWVLSVFTNVWRWLGSWSFHGIPFSSYLLGLAIVSIIIRFIFG